MTLLLGGMVISVFFLPLAFCEADNFILANPIITPGHIQPEWYFLFAYSILRSVPNKLGGVILMFMAITIFFFFPLGMSSIQGIYFAPIKKVQIILFGLNLRVLTWLGTKIADYPFNLLGFIRRITYFRLIILILKIR